MRFQLTRLATFTLVILLFFPFFASAQAVQQITLKQGTNTSKPINLIGSGVNLHLFNWNTVGTISAGACALLGGSDGVTFGTTLIAAQTVTSSGGPTALTAATTVNYVEISCTTPLMGTGSVVFHYSGAVTTAANVSVGSITVSGVNANLAAGTNATSVPNYSSLTGVNVGGNTVGVTGTGTSMNVTAIAGSTTAVTSLPALPAGTNVIGHTINDTGSTTTVTGNVTVVQPTGTSLHMTCDGGTCSGTGVAQGSPTSGQTGGLTQAAVTTAAPSYTTGQTSPLSLDTAGALRVTGNFSTGVAQGSITSGQTGSLMQGAVTTSAPSYGNGQTSPLSLDTSGALRVNTGNGVAAIVTINTAATGAVTVQQVVADGDVGNARTNPPVPVGGINETSRTTIGNNQVGILHFTTDQQAIVTGATVPGTVPAGTLAMVVQGTSNGIAVPVSCTSGCAAGTTDTDDGSVAGGQSTGIQIGLNYVWNGSNWIRALGNPCQLNTPVAFSVTTAAASATVVAAVNLKKPYLCDYKLNTGDAAGAFVTVVAGTGTTGQTAHDVFVGSAANNATDGWFLAVSGGGFVAMGGGVPAAWGSTAGDDIVLFTNGKKVNISGHYVHQGIVGAADDWRLWLALSALSLYGWRRKRRA